MPNTTEVNQWISIVSSEEVISFRFLDEGTGKNYPLSFQEATKIRNKLSNWMNHYRRLHPEVSE